MSLNECQIKRQSTKNATESTVSLGEKLADFGPAQVFARFSQNLVRVGSSSGQGFEKLRFDCILNFKIFKIRCELYFAPNYQFFSFHFFNF